MIIVYILVALITIVVAYWTIRNNNRSDELDEREEELYEYGRLLDERRNRIAEDEAQATRWYNSMKAEKERMDNATVYTTHYAVTETDELKFNTEKAIVANAKNRMAMTIAHDFVKKYEPKKERTERGTILLTYKFKIIEQ